MNEISELGKQKKPCHGVGWQENIGGKSSALTRVLFALTLVLGVAGCGATKVVIPSEEIARPDVSLVYGHIDMEDAPTPLQKLTFKQVAPEDKVEPYRWFAIGDYNGLFYHSALKPGSYQLVSFAGMSGWHVGGVAVQGKSHIFSFPAQGYGFRIGKPEMRFLGAYKYKRASSREFNIVPSKKPEYEVLELLLPEIEGSKWEKSVRRRIAELKK